MKGRFVGRDAKAGGGVIVVGDLVTDVLAMLDDALASDSDTRARIQITGGGQAANTAAWLAWLQVPVTLVAAAGDDEVGRVRVAELTTAGVQCAVRHDPDAPTGSVVVLVGGTGGGPAGPEGGKSTERTMVSDRGANLRLRPADVDYALAAAPDAVHLHLSGYTLLDDESRPAGLHALRAARERGLSSSVDAASARPLRQVGPSAFLGWVREVDLLLANKDEAAVLDQQGGLVAAAKSTVVKLGSEGASWTGPAGQTATVSSDPIPVADPTGAGDAFAAGLLAAWLAGADPAAALRAGARLGAIAVTCPGGRPGAEPASAR